MLRIAFAGTPNFSAHILEALIAEQEAAHPVLNLMAVLTAHDKQAGRGLRVQDNAVKRLHARKSLNIPLYQPQNKNDTHCYEALRALNLDVLVVVAYGIILPSAWLELPRYGCINVHPSLLPRWRGAAPIERTIMAGDKRTGISIMQMDNSIDGGPILNQKSCAVCDHDNATTLEHKLQVIAIDALLAVLRNLAKKGRAGLNAKPQQDTHAVLASKIKTHEQLLDWNEDARLLERRVRALDKRGYARLHITVDKLMILKVLSTQWKSHNMPVKAGTVLAVDKSGILVACAKDALLIERLQLPGKSHSLDATDLRNGYKHWFQSNGIFSVGAVIR